MVFFLASGGHFSAFLPPTADVRASCGSNKSAPAYISHPTAHLRHCSPPKTCSKSQPLFHPSSAEKIRARCINVHISTTPPTPPPTDPTTIGCLRFHVSETGTSKQRPVIEKREYGALTATLLCHHKSSSWSFSAEGKQPRSLSKTAAVYIVVGRKCLPLFSQLLSNVYYITCLLPAHDSLSAGWLVQQPSLLQRH